jgi:DtxR family transcriptional regulator, Mn-dependent transcriptional regulator
MKVVIRWNWGYADDISEPMSTFEMTMFKFESEPMENCLKAIYQLAGDDDGAGTQEIAVRLGVSASGVSKMLGRLARHNLVSYSPYRRVRLTPSGQKIALEVIRHHRLLELYLMESLGYPWDRVHSEAERLEHHISEEFEDSIERMLGFPEYDPHGDPIPGRDGSMLPHATLTLESQNTGDRFLVRRVTDEDGALLRYLGARGIRPGACVELLEREPFGGSIRIRVDDRLEQISPEAARQVFGEPAIDAATGGEIASIVPVGLPTDLPPGPVPPEGAPSGRRRAAGPRRRAAGV